MKFDSIMYLVESREEVMFNKYDQKIRDQLEHNGEHSNSRQTFQSLCGVLGMKYADWVIRQYTTGQFLLEDLSGVKTNVERFFQLAKKMEPADRDLNRHSYRQIVKLVLDAESSNESSTDSINKTDVDVLYDGPYGFMGIPTTEQAAKNLGKNTNWCTAYNNENNRFNDYNQMGPLIVYIQPNGTKCQLHFEGEQFMDRYDDPIMNVMGVLRKAPPLFELFKKYVQDKLELQGKRLFREMSFIRRLSKGDLAFNSQVHKWLIELHGSQDAESYKQDYQINNMHSSNDKNAVMQEIQACKDLDDIMNVLAYEMGAHVRLSSKLPHHTIDKDVAVAMLDVHDRVLRTEEEQERFWHAFTQTPLFRECLADKTLIVRVPVFFVVSHLTDPNAIDWYLKVTPSDLLNDVEICGTLKDIYDKFEKTEDPAAENKLRPYRRKHVLQNLRGRFLSLPPDDRYDVWCGLYGDPPEDMIDMICDMQNSADYLLQIVRDLVDYLEVTKNHKLMRTIVSKFDMSKTHNVQMLSQLTWGNTSVIGEVGDYQPEELVEDVLANGATDRTYELWYHLFSVHGDKIQPFLNRIVNQQRKYANAIDIDSDLWFYRQMQYVVMYNQEPSSETTRNVFDRIERGTNTDVRYLRNLTMLYAYLKLCGKDVRKISDEFMYDKNKSYLAIKPSDVERQVDTILHRPLSLISYCNDM